MRLQIPSTADYSFAWPCNFAIFIFIQHRNVPYCYRHEVVLALLGFIPIFSSRTPFGQPLVRKQTELTVLFPIQYTVYAFQ
jgi:hypothetical protein